jgi:hypothetical protein
MRVRHSVLERTRQNRVLAVRLSLKFGQSAQDRRPEVAADTNLVNHVIDGRARQGEYTSHESGERRGAKI